jgi:hypothetical protein
MPSSKRFRELKTRLNELRRHLLPITFSKTGDYSDRQVDRARGYRLLAHAEIEAFIEDQARETVTSALISWKKNQTSSTPLISFLAAYHSSWSIDDSISNEEIIRIAKSRTKVKESVNQVIDLAQKQFIQRIKDNHGVREANLLVLVIPAGIDPSELDPSWIANLDSFGKSRGEVAHNSKKTTTAIDPKNELDTVTNLLIGLEELDKKIGLLRVKSA